MAVPKKKLPATGVNTATFLLTKQPEDYVDDHRVKIVIVGSGYTGVAVGITILFKVSQISFNSFVFNRETSRTPLIFTPRDCEGYILCRTKGIRGMPCPRCAR